LRRTRPRHPAGAALLALALLALAPAAHARRGITVKFPRFKVPAHGEREVCVFVRLPRDEPFDSGGTRIVNVSAGPRFGSHHFIMWAYTGDKAADYPTGVRDGRTCLDFGADPDKRTLMGGALSGAQVARLPRGLAQRIEPVDDNGRKIIGLILNSHWLNADDRPRTAAVKVSILPASRKIKRYALPILDVIADTYIKVPPAELDTLPPDDLEPGIRTVSSTWGPNIPNFLGPLGGGRIPTGPVCLIGVSGHMHKRGKLFRVEHVGADGATVIFETYDYAHPRHLILSGVRGRPKPLLIRDGEGLRYTCVHDNGNTTPAKRSCEEHFAQAGRSCATHEECGAHGMCIDATCRNVPGLSPLEAFTEGRLTPDRLATGDFSFTGKACTTDADCPATDARYPDVAFTGRCVVANLVFGFGSDDEMCVMPGAFFEAVPGAPPGRECDVGLL